MRWRPFFPAFSLRRDRGASPQMIASGITPPTGALGRSMPAFGPQMSKQEITSLVKFLRARFGRGEPWKE